MRRDTYSNIDMLCTGRKIQFHICKAGYSVRDIQNYLHLACPQPIYRWYKGQMLPTVDHLFSLSKLLGIHMEDLLVEKDENYSMILELYRMKCKERLLIYYQWYTMM